MVCGASKMSLKVFFRERPVRKLKTSATSSVKRGSQDKMPQSV